MIGTFFWGLFYDIMGFTLAVSAGLAFAVRPAAHSRIKTLTVLFLAVTFLAVASLALPVPSRCGFVFGGLPRFFNFGLVVMVIVAPAAGAFRGAQFAIYKALTIHFQTFSLLACASRLLLFYLWGRNYGLVLGLVEFDVQRQLVIINILYFVRHVEIKTNCWVHGKIFVGLNK